MNKVLVKNNQYYIVKADDKFLARENKNSDVRGLPEWHYYLTSDPAKCVKCEDSFVAEVILEDYKEQVCKEIESQYGSFIKIDNSAFVIVQMVVSYQIGAK